MSDRLPYSFLFLYCLMASSIATIHAQADDPLMAMPTAENPLEFRIKNLSEEELNSIRLPDDKNQLIISIATGPIADASGEALKMPEPWLRVFADGRLEGKYPFPAFPDRHSDRLSPSELAWLLHIAVNECGFLNLSTKEIEERFAKHKSKPPANRKLPTLRGGPRDPQADESLPSNNPPTFYRYQIRLPAGDNELLIPDDAIVIRPLRKRMDLQSVASLHKYAVYLVARAALGSDEERQVILQELNSELQTQSPGFPPFRIEHLGEAGRIQFAQFAAEFVASFQQDVPMGDGSFKQATGMIIRKKGERPKYTVLLKSYRKASTGL